MSFRSHREIPKVQISEEIRFLFAFFCKTEVSGRGELQLRTVQCSRLL